MIIDHRGWTHNIIAGHLPGKPMPKEWMESGLVQRAPTIAELARRIGVPADRSGRRRPSASTGSPGRAATRTSIAARVPTTSYYGNPDSPNPNLGEVSKPPFYAFRLVPGDLGTKGGLLTDEDGRVLREDG